MAAYLYRKDHPKGRLFDTDEDMKKALADGWVDAPGKVNDPVPKSVPPELLPDFPAKPDAPVGDGSSTQSGAADSASTAGAKQKGK